MPFELGRDAVSVSSLQRKHISFEHDLQTLGSAVRKQNYNFLISIFFNPYGLLIPYIYRLIYVVIIYCLYAVMFIVWLFHNCNRFSCKNKMQIAGYQLFISYFFLYHKEKNSLLYADINKKLLSFQLK